MKRANEIAVLVVLLLFAMVSAVRHFSSPGADLASSYYGCRLLASHQDEHIYSRDAWDYDHVSDPVWDRLALVTGFGTVKLLHPFVQTPIWAYSLEPLCTRLRFPAFNKLFLFLLSFSLAATIWLVARFWAPRTLHPGWIALVCAVLYLSEAYKYTFVLTQTHMIFVLLTVAAIVLARRGSPVWAGALLAVAADVKITPAFLLLYWLVNRQKKAALSFVLFSVALAAASVWSTGWALNLTFLRNLSEISNMLLVSWNNQSLAAFLLAPHYPAIEQQFWHSFHLPAAVKWGSTLLSLGFTLLGGLLDRKTDEGGGRTGPPYGAVLAIVGALVFAPLAWTHYYILLVIPLMMMLDASLRKRSFVMLALLILICALNVDTQTLGGVLQKYRLFPVVRAQFYSGLLTMAALIVLWKRERLHSTHLRD